MATMNRSDVVYQSCSPAVQASACSTSQLLSDSVKGLSCLTNVPVVATAATTKPVETATKGLRSMRWLSFILLFFFIALILGLTRPNWVTKRNGNTGDFLINWWALIFWSLIIALIIFLIIWLFRKLVENRRNAAVLTPTCVKTCETAPVVVQQCAVPAPAVQCAPVTQCVTKPVACNTNQRW